MQATLICCNGSWKVKLTFLTDLKKKDWIEQPLVLAPTKLKPAAPYCWDHFGGKAILYAMGKITFKKIVPSSLLISGIACRSRVVSK